MLGSFGLCVDTEEVSVYGSGKMANTLLHTPLPKPPLRAEVTSMQPLLPRQGSRLISLCTLDLPQEWAGPQDENYLLSLMQIHI